MMSGHKSYDLAPSGRDLIDTLPDDRRSDGLTLDDKTKQKLESFDHTSADAIDWARMFAVVFKQNPQAAADEDYLLAIFATAIQAGAEKK